MNPILRNILAVIIGWAIGSIINMSLLQIGHTTMPIEGIDPNDMDALAEIMPTLESKYFTFPFLAHALGALVGAFIAGMIAKVRKMRAAFIVGVLFLIGGIFINYIITGPLWYTIVDITLAYIPMAWIGGKLAQKFSKKN